MEKMLEVGGHPGVVVGQFRGQDDQPPAKDSASGRHQRANGGKSEESSEMDHRSGIGPSGILQRRSWRKKSSN